MLAWRLAISAILIPLLIGIFILDARAGESAPYLLGLLLLLGLRGVWELADLFSERVPRLHWPAMFLCVAAILVGGWFPHLQDDPPRHLELTPLALAFCFSLMLLCAIEAMRFRGPGDSLETLATEVLIVSYVGFLLAMVGQLRWVAGPQAGYLVIGSLMLCAKGGDIGAYFVGKRFGRHKLVPVLSPGKTWEGVIGALLGSGLCGWTWLSVATPMFMPEANPPAWYVAIFYGSLIGVVGMIGDLCESLLKRDVGRKDSAALFPGFGGILDMLDSVLYAGPVVLLLWKVLPLAEWVPA